MTITRYVVLHPDEDGGYWVEVPSLPGCISEGDTRDEALENIKDAIEGYIASLQKHGEPIPDDNVVVVTV
jgi:antitoxin HicB